jgi:xanthine dehydrogenase accessory factor
MRELLKKMSAELEAGGDVVLVTVIASSGATPRGAGARMLITAKGRAAGTIGGGAVEYRSEQIAAGVLKEKQSMTQAFTLTKEDVNNLGMICGGAVTIYFHYVPAGDKTVIALLHEAERRFENGDDLWLVTEVSGAGALGLYTRDAGFQFLDVPEELLDALKSKPRTVTVGERKFYVEKLASSATVYVFGCGHVGQALVPVLEKVGFRCVALDDRPDFANRTLFPDADEVKVIDLEHISDSVTIGPEDYVVVMTRGHMFDTIVQAQALRTPCCYIGVIGSHHKKAGVFQKLREMGFTDTDLERITTPIGLEIAAETPAEISISIAAQLIELRARRNAEA